MPWIATGDRCRVHTAPSGYPDQPERRRKRFARSAVLCVHFSGRRQVGPAFLRSTLVVQLIGVSLLTDQCRSAARERCWSLSDSKQTHLCTVNDDAFMNGIRQDRCCGMFSTVPPFGRKVSTPGSLPSYWKVPSGTRRQNTPAASVTFRNGDHLILTNQATPVVGRG